MLTLSETWSKANVSDSEIYITWYILSRNDRDSRIVGGTLAYIRDGLPYCVALIYKHRVLNPVLLKSIEVKLGNFSYLLYIRLLTKNVNILSKV